MLELTGIQVLRRGGAGYKTVLVLDGTADCYFFPTRGTKKWDTCATEALIVCVGGTVTDCLGNPIPYAVGPGITLHNEHGILITLHNHQKYLDLLLQNKLQILLQRTSFSPEPSHVKPKWLQDLMADDWTFYGGRGCPLVLDNGSAYMKVGFANDEAPAEVFPSVVGWSRTLAGTGWPKCIPLASALTNETRNGTLLGKIPRDLNPKLDFYRQVMGMIFV